MTTFKGLTPQARLMFRNRDFLLTVVFCVLLGLLSSLVLLSSPVTLNLDTSWGLFGSKLTFLSILVVVGFIQYEYFINFCRTFFERILPLLIQMERQATSATVSRMAPNTQAARSFALAQTEVARLPAELSRYLQLVSTSLSILFGTGFSLVVSLAADLPNNLVGELRLWSAFSYGNFVASLIMFVVLLVYYLAVVIRQLRVVSQQISQILNRRDTASEGI